MDFDDSIHPFDEEFLSSLSRALLVYTHVYTHSTNRPETVQVRFTGSEMAGETMKLNLNVSLTLQKPLALPLEPEELHSIIYNPPNRDHDTDWILDDSISGIRIISNSSLFSELRFPLKQFSSSSLMSGFTITDATGITLIEFPSEYLWEAFTYTLAGRNYQGVFLQV